MSRPTEAASASREGGTARAITSATGFRALAPRVAETRSVKVFLQDRNANVATDGGYIIIIPTETAGSVRTETATAPPRSYAPRLIGGIQVAVYHTTRR